jgi:hypothetical protein
MAENIIIEDGVDLALWVIGLYIFMYFTKKLVLYMISSNVSLFKNLVKVIYVYIDNS